MFGLVSVTPRAAQRALAGDLDRQHRMMAAQNAAPAAENISFFHCEPLLPLVGARVEDRGSRIEDRGSRIEDRLIVRKAIFYLRFSILNPRSSKLSLRYRRGVAAHPVKRLFDDPAEHGLVIVVMTEHVLRRREAMRVAALLHLAELFAVELGIFDGPPVV